MFIKLQIRTDTIAGIFRKTLKLASNARQKYTVGEITNLISVDGQRMFDTTLFLPTLWFAPMEVILSMFFLYQEVGVATFAGNITSISNIIHDMPC